MAPSNEEEEEEVVDLASDSGSDSDVLLSQRKVQAPKDEDSGSEIDEGEDEEYEEREEADGTVRL